MDNVSSASIMEDDSIVDTAMYEDISRSSGDTITAQGAGRKPATKPVVAPCFRYEDVSRTSGDTIAAQGAGQHKPAGKPAIGPCFRY
jgi:hypothetical protein